MKIIIALTDEQLVRLKRPLKGSGGWQSLLRNIQKRINGTNLELSVRDVCRILRYSKDYGEGGFQGRLQGTVEQTELLAISILGALRIDVPDSLQTRVAPQASLRKKFKRKASRKETG